ncbi:hypothetical protein V1277_000749 [Bradyrhizobium sp. AZCC 1588]|uniref:hypothetical protein n=1 Tax=unclassified Bradyrhizobium TaxID=2631580 RepID=UPI002FF2CE81
MGVGLALGFLIGIISGTVFLLLLKTAVSNPDKGASSIVTLTAQLFAMPTFWFGGPWLTTKLLEAVQMSELINPYVASLAVTFSSISLYPAARWIMQLGEDFGRRRGEP